MATDFSFDLKPFHNYKYNDPYIADLLVDISLI